MRRTEMSDQVARAEAQLQIEQAVRDIGWSDIYERLSGQDLVPEYLLSEETDRVYELTQEAKIEVTFRG